VSDLTTVIVYTISIVIDLLLGRGIFEDDDVFARHFYAIGWMKSGVELESGEVGKRLERENDSSLLRS